MAKKIDKKQELVLAPTLTAFEKTKSDLELLRSDYDPLVVTEANLKEADKARLVLKNVRLAIKNTAKENRRLIKEFLKEKNDDLEDELIGIIEPTEKRIEADVNKVTDAIEERKRLEEQRKQGHQNLLQEIRNKTTQATNSDSIEVLNGLNEYVLSDLEEFQPEGEELLATLKLTVSNRIKMIEFEQAQKAMLEKQAETITEIIDNDPVIQAEIETRAIDSPLEKGIYREVPKHMPISSMNKVMIGNASSVMEPQLEKDILISFGEYLTERVVYPSQGLNQEALKHVQYVKSCIDKLAEQTIKKANTL